MAGSRNASWPGRTATLSIASIILEQAVANYADATMFKLGRRMGIRSRSALVTAVFRKAMTIDMSSADAGQLQVNYRFLFLEGSFLLLDFIMKKVNRLTQRRLKSRAPSTHKKHTIQTFSSIFGGGGPFFILLLQLFSGLFFFRGVFRFYRLRSPPPVLFLQSEQHLGGCGGRS